MKYNDGLKLSGKSKMTVWPKGLLPSLMENMSYDEARVIAEGMQLHRNEVHNLIVSAGKNLVADLLLDVSDAGISYHAIGTTATAPAAGDTTLTAEAERKLWTSRSRLANIATFSVFYTAAECTYAIVEAGTFGGAATATADTGTMFSHYLQAYDNSAGTYDLTFDYILTIGG